MTVKNGRPILLLGSFGRGNIGDEAFLAAAKELFPPRKIYINCSDPLLLSEEARGFFKIVPTSFGEGLFEKIKMFISVGSIVYWGGDVWVELYGNRVPRLNLYLMIIINAIGRLSGKKISYVGCGIGDLRGFSLVLAKLSARMAHNVAVRETRTKDILAIKSVRYLPDITVNLPFYEGKNQPNVGANKINIGLSVLFYIPNAKEAFPVFVKQLIAALANLPKEKYKFTLLPMLVTNQVLYDDIWASEKISARLIELGYDVEMHADSSIEKFIAKISQLDIVIGTRLHANILAMFSGVPAIGISYRPKVMSFFRDNKMTEYCIGLDELSELTQKINAVAGSIGDEKRKFEKISFENLKYCEEYRQFVEAV